MSSSFLRYLVFGIVEHPRKAPRRQARVYRGPLRDWQFRAWVRSLPCAACQCTRFVEAAHTGSDGGMKQKSTDRSCIPLCAVCHRVGPRSLHQIGRTEFESVNGLTFEALVIRLNADYDARFGSAQA